MTLEYDPRNHSEPIGQHEKPLHRGRIGWGISADAGMRTFKKNCQMNGAGL